MATSTEKYHLLEHDISDDRDSDNTSGHDDAENHSSSIKISYHRRAGIIANFLAVLIIALLTACLGLLVRLQGKTCSSSGAGCEQSLYAQLTRDKSVPWPYNTGYGADITNHTLLDERWEAIDINDGIIAVDHNWAYEQNLGSTQNFPWDQSKGLYLITAFHQLHCLKTLHHTVYALHHGYPVTSDTNHALHCLDHMRVDTMCEADDFLLPTGPSRYMSKGPFGQARVCRNWDQLVAWARERNACYQHITDNEDKFAVENSEIERYLNCPKDSPYMEKMMQYKMTSDL